MYHVNKDPLHFRGKIPLQTAKEITDKVEIIQDMSKKGEIEYPFLIFGGTKDELCYPPSWKDFYDVCLPHMFLF